MSRLRSRPDAREAYGAVPRTRGEPSAALQLQRMAGNRATAQLIQRVQVTGTVTTNPNQKHHPHYDFTYPGQQHSRRFDLDQWITNKIESPAVAHAARVPGTAGRVAQAVHGWDGNATIVGTLVDQLIATGPVADWRTADVDPAALGDDPAKSLVPLLLSMKANIRLREDDIPNNVPTNLTITGTPKRVTKFLTGSESKPAIDWGSVLRTARLALKAKLDKQQPEWAPADKDDVRLVDDAIETSTDAGLVELRRIGYLTLKDGQQRTTPKPKTGTGGSVVNYDVAWTGEAKSFNFGLNHLRFILFMEWKLLTELLKPKPQ